MFTTLRGLASRWLSAVAGCLCVLSLFSTPVSAANWATSQVRIVGTRLAVSPANQAVPLNTPTIVNTSLAGSLAALPPEYAVRGLFADEGGHVYPQPIELRAAPNQPLQIPPLLTPGRYFLRGIRLFAGDVPLADAVPSQVEIDASEIVVSQVTSRPMTMAEIQQSGVSINENDYKAYRFTIGIGTESTLRNFDFPVLFPKQGLDAPAIVLKDLKLPGPPAPPDVAPAADLPDIAIVPISFPDDVQYDNPTEPRLNLSGVLVFPSSITFLNQFFAVNLLLQNGAPASSSLRLESVTATIEFPDGSRFVLKEPTRPPLVNGEMPLASALLPQGQAQGEFDVTTPRAGTYVVKIHFKGTLTGLPTGKPRAIAGEASGVVVVQDPTFHVNFSHPSVVRQGQEYSLLVTLTNTSTVDANAVALALPDRLSGAVLLSGQNPDGVDNRRTLPTLKAGDSWTTEFKLRALVTGQVRASTLAGDPSVSGAIQLLTAVGDGGVPLSPDTLILPDVVRSQLPTPVVGAGLELLGLGWSLAAVPPDQRPANLAPISAADVHALADQLTALAREVEIGASVPAPAFTQRDAMDRLALLWCGSDSQRPSFDSLRRIAGQGSAPYVPSKGERFAAALGAYMVRDGESALDAHAVFASATRTLAPHLSISLDSTRAGAPPLAWIEDVNRRRTGDSNDGRLVRELPWSEVYPLPGGRIFVIGHLDGTDNVVFHLQGTGSGTVGLSVVAPLPGGVRLARFEDVPTAAGSSWSLSFNPQTAELTLVGGDLTVLRSTSSETVHLPAFAPLGAEQDLMADQSGRAVAVLFSRPVDDKSAADASRYAVSTRLVTGAYPQPGGRVVEVRARSRISPLVDNEITISDVHAIDGSPMAPTAQTLRVRTAPAAPAGTVSGTVFGSDGAPLAGATVVLWEHDEDLLREHQNDMEESNSVFATQEATSDAQGRFAFDYVRLAAEPFRIEATDPATGQMARLRGSLAQDGQHLDVVLFMRVVGAIQGHVLAPGGSPAAGAVVAAFDPQDPQQVVQTVSDAMGQYRVEGVAIGTTSVIAGASGGAHAYATIDIQRAGAVVNLDLQLVATPLATLRGRVTRPAGAAVAAAVVRATQPGVTGAVYSGADGTFVIPNLPAGTYVVEAQDGGGHRGSLSSTISGAQSLDVGTIVIGDGGGTGRVSGVVYNPDGTVAGGAAVYLTSGATLQAQTVSDVATGAFAFADVPIGPCALRAFRPSTHQTAGASFALSFDGQTTVANLYFGALGALSGTVRRYAAGGAPTAAAGVAVYLDGPGGPQIVADGAGRYHFDDVRAGTHRVFALDGTNDIGWADAFVGRDGDMVQGADVQMIGRGDLTVHVANANGQPVGALVAVRTATIDAGSLGLVDGYVSDYAAADTGDVSFHGLLATTVAITADNGFDGRAGTSATIAGGRSAGATVTLGTSGYLKGTVLAPDGLHAVPLAIVTLRSAGMPDRTVGADESGAYRFSVVPLGSTTVVAQDPNTGRTGQSTGLVSMNHTTEDHALSLDVRLLGEGAVQGVVLEEDGAGRLVAAANARIVLRGRSGGFNRSVGADLAGQFSFSGLQEGEYSLEASDLSHQFPLGGRAQVTVAAGETAQTSVTLGSFGRVTGTLSDVARDGTTSGVANAQIELHLAAPVQETGYAISDAQGRFSFDYVPVSAVPFEIAAFDAASYRSARASGVLSTAGQTTDVALRLGIRGSVSGTVRHYADAGTVGIAVAEPSVWLGTTAGRLSTTGDEYGQFHFDGVPEGTFDIGASDPASGAGATAHGVVTSDARDVVIDLAMPPSGAIAGTVVAADGTTPVFGAVVGFDGCQAGTSGDGRFQFRGVALGKYRLVARDSSTPDAGFADVSLTANGQVVDVTVRMIGLGDVRGAVVDSGGHGLPGFQVTLVDRNSLETNSPVIAQTDASGAFDFPRQRVGDVSVSAVAPPGSTDVRRGSATGRLEAAGATLELTVSVTRAGVVRGTLVDAKQSPVKGASVQLIKPEEGAWYAGTDGSGLFTFPVIPVGSTGSFSVAIVGPLGGRARAAGTLPLDQDAPAVDLGAIVLDEVPPVLAGSFPVDGATAVARTVAPAVVFAEDVDASTVGPDTVFLIDDTQGTRVAGAVGLAPDGRTVTLAPAQPLRSDAAYSLHVSAAVLDLAGNAGSDRIVRFRTLDDIPPLIVSSYPVAGSMQVEPEAVPFVIFSEAVDGTAATFAVTCNGAVAMDGGPFMREDEPSKVLFKRNEPSSLLPANAICTLAVAGVRDRSGNAMTPWTATFTTVDTMPPTVTLQVPAGAVVPSQRITLIASVQDNVGVARVEFYAAGAALGSATKAPFEVAFTAPTALGPIDVRAVAVDFAGNSAESMATITVSNDITPPAVVIDFPPPGRTFLSGSSIDMAATANDDSGVASVEFVLQDGAGNTLASSSALAAPYGASVVVPSLPDDDVECVLVARATDAVGNRGTSTAVAVHLRKRPVGGNLPLDGRAFRVARRGAYEVVVGTQSSSDIGKNHVYLVNAEVADHPYVRTEWSAAAPLQDMKVDGDLVAVADGGVTLLRIDGGGTTLAVGAVIPASVFATNAGCPETVALKGGLLFVGNCTSVWTIDVSDPSHPRQAGGSTSTGTAGWITDLTVADGVLYAGTTDPANLVVSGTLDGGGIPAWRLTSQSGMGLGSAPVTRLLAADGILYASRSNGLLSVFRLPWLSLSRQEGFAGSPFGAVTSGHDVVVAAGSQGVAWRWLGRNSGGSIASRGEALDVALTGRGVAVADGDAGVSVVVPTAMRPAVDGSRLHVDVAGGVVTLVGGAGTAWSAMGPMTFSVAEGDSATPLASGVVAADGSLNAPLSTWPDGGAVLTLSDSGVYPLDNAVTFGTKPLGVARARVELADPTAQVRQLRWLGNGLVINGTTQVAVADLSAPLSPRIRATWSASATIEDVAVAGDVVLVADGGLHLLRLNGAGDTLEELAQVPASAFSSVDGRSYATGDGARAYFGRGGTVWSIDISEPTRPVVAPAGNPLPAGRVAGMAISDGSVVVSAETPDSWCATSIFRSAPGATLVWEETQLNVCPNGGRIVGDGERTLLIAGTQVAELHSDGSETTGTEFEQSAQGATVVGDKIYAALGWGGVASQSNLGDPGHSGVATAGFARDVKVRGGIAYVGEGAGISVVEFAGETLAVSRRLVSLTEASGGAAVRGEEGAVTGGVAPLTVTIANSRTGKTESVAVRGDGSFAAEVEADPGDQVLLTASDSEAPPQSVVLDLGRVPPVGSLGAVAVGAARQALLAGHRLFVNKGDRILVFDVRDVSAPKQTTEWIAPTAISTIAVDGDSVYVSDDGFRVLQLAEDGSALNEMARIDAAGAALALRVVGGRVVAREAGGLVLIDVSTSGAPFVAFGECNPSSGTNSNGGDVAVDGRRVIMGLPDEYDYAGFAMWRLAGDTLVPMPGASFGIWEDPLYPGRVAAAHGVVAGAGTWSGKGVGVFQFDADGVLQRRGSVSLGGTATSIAIDGSLILVGLQAGNRIEVLDGSDLNALPRLGTVPLAGVPYDISVRKDVVAVATGAGVWLGRIAGRTDLSFADERVRLAFDGSSARVMGGIDAVLGAAPARARIQNQRSGATVEVDVEADGDFSAHVPAESGDMLTVTVVDGTAQTTSATIGPVPSMVFGGQVALAGGMSARRVAAVGSGLVVSSGTALVYVDPASPDNVGPQWTASGEIVGLAVVGDRVYVADDSLAVLRVTPNAITELGRVDFGGSGGATNVSFAVDGTHVYLAPACGGVCVVDVADPSNGSVLGALWLDSWANGVAMCGGTLRGAMPAGQVFAGDFSDPANPTAQSWTLHSEQGWSAAMGLRVVCDGARLFGTDAENGIFAADFPAGQDASLAWRFAVGGTAQAFALDGERLLVAAGGGGLKLVDRSDPATPRVADSVMIPGGAVDVCVSGGVAYVASGDGLYAVRLFEPSGGGQGGAKGLRRR